MLALKGQDFKFSMNKLITCILYLESLDQLLQDVLLLITDDIFVFVQFSQRLRAYLYFKKAINLF